MSSSVLNLNTLPARQGGSIGAALAEVTVAFKHLATALVRKVLLVLPVRKVYRDRQELLVLQVYQVSMRILLRLVFHNPR